jgi:hypothetical protein
VEVAVAHLLERQLPALLVVVRQVVLVLLFLKLWGKNGT